MENPRGWYGESRAHATAARKGWRSRRRNPDVEMNPDIELDVENPRIAPYSYYKTGVGKVSVPGHSRRKARRNPVNPKAGIMSGLQERMYGVGIKELLGAVGGISAATIVPGLIIKDEPTDNKGKALKILTALGIVVGLGTAARTFADVETGRAVVIGGLVGMTSQAIAAFTDYELFGITQKQRRVGAAPRVIQRVSSRPAIQAPTIRGSATQAVPVADEDVIISVT